MINKYNRMASRVAFYVIAKGRPDDLFHAVFYDIRQKDKDLKEKWALEAQKSLRDILIKDLNDLGVKIVSVFVLLGKYRGSHFITSAKVTVQLSTPEKAQALAKHLLKYSPKYVLKKFEDGVAEYNIR